MNGLLALFRKMKEGTAVGGLFPDEAGLGKLRDGLLQFEISGVASSRINSETESW